jgi:hypothetical protein
MLYGSKQLYSRDLRSAGQTTEDDTLMQFGNSDNVALGSPNSWTLSESAPANSHQFFNKFNINIKDYFFHDMGQAASRDQSARPQTDFQSFQSSVQSMEVQEPNFPTHSPPPTLVDLISCPLWLMAMLTVFLLCSMLR